MLSPKRVLCVYALARVCFFVSCFLFFSFFFFLLFFVFAVTKQKACGGRCEAGDHGERGRPGLAHEPSVCSTHREDRQGHGGGALRLARLPPAKVRHGLSLLLLPLSVADTTAWYLRM